MARNGREFTVKEIKFLEENYNEIHYKKIAEILNRHPKCIHRKLMTLGLKPTGNGNNWSNDEVKYLKENLTDLESIKKIAEHLNRSISAVNGKINRLQLPIHDTKAKWSDIDLHYLEDKWGVLSVKRIAKHLNRTENAIIHKACDMGFGKRIGNGYCIDDIVQMFNIPKSTVYGWITRGLLPAKQNTTTKRNYYVINELDLKKFLFSHQDLWDSRKMEINIFMDINQRNPEWLEEKFQTDKKRSFKEGTRYTKEEDDLIVRLFYQDKRSREIAEIIGRSERSVRARLARIRYGSRG